MYKISYQVEKDGGIAVCGHVPEGEESEKNSGVSDQVRDEQEDGQWRIDGLVVFGHDDFALKYLNRV